MLPKAPRGVDLSSEGVQECYEAFDHGELQLAGGPWELGIATTIAESEGFWDDSEPDRDDRMAETSESFEQHFREVVTTLTATWGEPQWIGGAYGDPAPAGTEAFHEAISYVGGSSLAYWSRPTGIACVYVVHEDKELPVQLFLGARTPLDGESSS